MGAGLSGTEAEPHAAERRRRMRMGGVSNCDEIRRKLPGSE